jgi:hypothetical protein
MDIRLHVIDTEKRVSPSELERLEELKKQIKMED